MVKYIRKCSICNKKFKTKTGSRRRCDKCYMKYKLKYDNKNQRGNKKWNQHFIFIRQVYFL